MCLARWREASHRRYARTRCEARLERRHHRPAVADNVENVRDEYECAHGNVGADGLQDRLVLIPHHRYVNADISALITNGRAATLNRP